MDAPQAFSHSAWATFKVRDPLFSHLYIEDAERPSSFFVQVRGAVGQEHEGLFHVPPQGQGSELAKMLGCEIAAMGQAPAGVKGDPRTRETSVAGVYVDIFRTKSGATLQLRGAEQDARG